MGIWSPLVREIEKRPSTFSFGMKIFDIDSISFKTSLDFSEMLRLPTAIMMSNRHPGPGFTDDYCGWCPLYRHLMMIDFYLATRITVISRLHLKFRTPFYYRLRDAARNILTHSFLYYLRRLWVIFYSTISFLKFVKVDWVYRSHDPHPGVYKKRSQQMPVTIHCQFALPIHIIWSWVSLGWAARKQA